MEGGEKTVKKGDLTPGVVCGCGDSEKKLSRKTQHKEAGVKRGNAQYSTITTSKSTSKASI